MEFAIGYPAGAVRHVGSLSLLRMIVTAQFGIACFGLYFFETTATRALDAPQSRFTWKTDAYNNMPAGLLTTVEAQRHRQQPAAIGEPSRISNGRFVTLTVCRYWSLARFFEISFDFSSHSLYRSSHSCWLPASRSDGQDSVGDERDCVFRLVPGRRRRRRLCAEQRRLCHGALPVPGV